MQLKQFNKATAATIGGAIVSVLGAVVELDPEVLSSLQVIIVSALVYFVPNLSNNGDDDGGNAADQQ